jgi:hypothetical protein
MEMHPTPVALIASKLVSKSISNMMRQKSLHIDENG